MLTSSFISKNLRQSQMTNYVYTAMVSHRGTPISLAMRSDGLIFYSVLDLSNTQQNGSKQLANGQDPENDKNYWSNVIHTDDTLGSSKLRFPREIAQVGYGIVPNRRIGNYDDNNKKISPDKNDTDKGKENHFYSTTARLGAVAPFQALSDGKYVYIFRQSVAKDDAKNIKNDTTSIVDNTLLVDRFILSGTTLKLSREIRYQRSRNKTEPASRKDTLSAVDIEGKPFYEPTRELAFVNNLSETGGNFSVLLLPGASAEEQRWQIFSYDTAIEKINSFNIRFDFSIVFDTSDSEDLADAFIQQYGLDEDFIDEVQTEIGESKSDKEITASFLNKYKSKNLPEDALAEVVYTVRKGVSKDDFIPSSDSEWPLMEYTKDGKTIKAEYLDSNVLKPKYAFKEEILPASISYKVKNGLSACYYYQKEVMADNKAMKTKACVMLTMGLEDRNATKYIGILNFSVASSGKLSRLTKDMINLPDINVQALDENQYKDLTALNEVGGQTPQKMNLLDIDNNGLSTSGGVLKFAYTSSDQAVSEGYSNATEATFPNVFDDSLGRVNLYFKGKHKPNHKPEDKDKGDNFFVMYFNPTGNKSLNITDKNGKKAVPPLTLKPRLDQDMTITVAATPKRGSNTTTVTMESKIDEVEKWKFLPERVTQIADILTGNGELLLAKLDSLKNLSEPNAAYLKPISDTSSKVVFRTTKDNNLMFNSTSAFASDLADGNEHEVALEDLSAFLDNNKGLTIAKKDFEIVEKQQIKIKADVLYKSYLSGFANTTEDIDKIWDYLKTSLIKEIPTDAIINASKTTTIDDGANFKADDTTLSVISVENLGIKQGDYIRIDNEILCVLNISGNDLEVSRGQLSTTTANHTNGATITYDSCLLNGAVTTTEDKILVTSSAALGIVRGDIIQVRNEKFLVNAVSGNELTITRGANSSKIDNHNNGSKVSMFQKGVPNIQGYLTSNTLTGTKAKLAKLITDTSLKSLDLKLFEVGNKADKKNRRAALKQKLIKLLLDVAKTRILTFHIQDKNTQLVDRLSAGLVVNIKYNYTDNFECSPSNASTISADKWEHHRSYLFNATLKEDASINTLTEITNSFNYTYHINNTIGQWEDWKPSLALEFKPKSVTIGALLATTNPEKLEKLSPTEKGLSLEAWIKPSQLGTTNQIIYYKKNETHYSLGIEKDGDKQFKCVATLGTNKYITQKSYDFNSSVWKHLAFTHRKYWGYSLNNNEKINCGNDDSLHLDDEFTLEVLVQIDKEGTLLQKEGEYQLAIKSGKITFSSANDGDYLNELPLARKPAKIDTGKFYKITVIRSKNKPQTSPSKADYPITGQKESNGDKWYEGKDSDDIVKGMAEKQDQMEDKMDFAQGNMFGSLSDKDKEEKSNPEYWHTLIISDTDGNLVEEWQTSEQKRVSTPQKFKNFIIGGGDFTGSFDSVRIWNRPLSKDDAKRLDLPESKAGLISHWRMVEGKGKYLYDNIGENHGVALGGSWKDSPRTGQAGQFQFYLNGDHEPHEMSTQLVEASVDQFSIGGCKASVSSNIDYFNGSLEEIRVWNKPRTNEQITDNTFGRLKGEWDQLLANYTFDTQMVNNIVKDASTTTANLILEGDKTYIKEVLSTAPVATEIPQVRSALTGVQTNYYDTLKSRPQIVEYGDVQKNDDGTLSGILKRCYSFIDADGRWNRMTGYKVGNLISQWYGQAQFAPQVMGYLEGPPPVPGENFPMDKSASLRFNSVSFNQAEKVSYNYSTSKEGGWNAGIDSSMNMGVETSILIAPLGIGKGFKLRAGMASSSNWETSGKRSESYERGVSVNTTHSLNARLSGYDDSLPNGKGYHKLGNTGYALVKSKTADIYLLRLEHNNALVSISWQPNPDLPEDVNILPFPINPLYTKQGTLDGKFGDTTDKHYPEAHGAYGEYSYFKPREAYKLKKQIERNKAELHAFFEDSFDVTKVSDSFMSTVAKTGGINSTAFIPLGWGTAIASVFNQSLGKISAQAGYNNTKLKEDLAKMGSQRNLVNTYVWTIEGGFYAEATEVAEVQQETFTNNRSLSLEGGMGMVNDVASGFMFDQKTLFNSGSSFTLTKSKTKESSTSFGLDIGVRIPTSPRYKYAGVDGRSLVKGLIKPGTVDAYRFMSFYLEPKGKNFTDLFTDVIDPIWLDQSPDPNAQALRQARGKMDSAKPCWRIMHRVTYVSRILPEFTPQAPPSLEKSTRTAGFESNYGLIKRFEPYVKNCTTSEQFFNKIEEIIDTQLPEFAHHKEQIKTYLALYFNIETV